MDWVIVVLVCFGLAFDVFSVAVSQGSVLGKVKTRGLVLMCLLVWAWQLISTSIGYYISSLLNVAELSEDVRGVWGLVAATFFVGCGGVKIFLVQRRKSVPEVCSEIDFRRINAIAGPTSIYTFFVSMGCGFLVLNPVHVCASICLLTIGIVIAGVYIGYRNGELNKKVYWTGGIFLIGAGAMVIMQYITRVIGG